MITKSNFGVITLNIVRIRSSVRSPPGTFGSAPEDITVIVPCSPSETCRTAAIGTARPGEHFGQARRAAAAQHLRDLAAAEVGVDEQHLEARAAPTSAKLIAESVFPSPGSGEVKTTTLSGFSRCPVPGW